MKIKIAVVDDQLLFRQGLMSLLKEFEGLEVIIEANNGKELIDAIEASNQKPDVVLLDLEMPVMCGMATTEYLNLHHPEIKILIITMHDDASFISALLNMGAHEFLLKEFSIESITHVIYSVMRSDYEIRGSISKVVLDELSRSKKIKPVANPDNLSNREIQVIQCVSQELTSKEISEKLFISPKTVGRHKENIQQKTKKRTTIGMLMYALKNNLIG